MLKAQLWRVDCPRCGVVVEQVSWAERKSGFTKPFEDQVAWLAQRCDKTTISKLMRIAWRSVGSCIERAVARYREPFDPNKLRAISVDELSYRKGQHYVTLVVDLDAGRIIWSKEGRSSKTLRSFFDELGEEVCARIQHAAIDMSAAYRKAIVPTVRTGRSSRAWTLHAERHIPLPRVRRGRTAPTDARVQRPPPASSILAPPHRRAASTMHRRLDELPEAPPHARHRWRRAHPRTATDLQRHRCRAGRAGSSAALPSLRRALQTTHVLSRSTAASR